MPYKSLDQLAPAGLPAPTDIFGVQQGSPPGLPQLRQTHAALRSWLMSSAASGWNIITPSGGDDYPQLSAAFANAANVPVWLIPGATYIVRQSGLAIPQKGTVASMSPNLWNGGGNNAQAAGAIITSTDNGSFSNGQAFIKMHDKSALVGVVINGLRTYGGVQVDGIDARNATGVLIENVGIMNCYNGINRYSNGAVPGDTLGFSQLALIRGSWIMGNSNYGYYSGGTNGGFVSDERIEGVNFAFNGAGQIYCNGTTGLQIVGCRLEDGTHGIDFINATLGLVSGCTFDRLWPPVTIQDSSVIGVVGNMFSGYPNSEGGPSEEAISLAGKNTRLTIGPNNIGYHFVANYRLASGAFVSGDSVFYDNTGGDTGRYFDGYTAGMLAGLFNPAGGFVNQLDPAWTVNNSTLAYAAAEGPVGGPTAMRITESSANSNHEIHQLNFGGLQNYIGSGNYTLSLYVHSGSSGSRNVRIGIWLMPGYTDSAWAIFNPSTGALVSSAAGGNLSLLGTPSSTPLPGGWYKCYLSFSSKLTTGGMTDVYITLTSGTTSPYPGDGASNVLVATPALKQGLL
jgi:hypothetical protein